MKRPERPRKSSPRLSAFDYTESRMYFVTICTFQRQLLFGDVVNQEMNLNAFGEIATRCWHDLPDHYHAALDAFVVMPNHVHAIIEILPPKNEINTDEKHITDVGTGLRPVRTEPVPTHNDSDHLLYLPDTETGLPHGDGSSISDVGTGLKPVPTHTSNIRKTHDLSEIIRGFKTFSARRINEIRNTSGRPVWQRSYYDHIIRKHESLNKIRQYIQSNPANWPQDTLYTDLC